MLASIEELLYTLTFISILRFNLGPIILFTSAILSLFAFCIGCISQMNSKEQVDLPVELPVDLPIDEDPQPLEL